ncbi:MAG: NAD(P)-binding protein [Burkholderiales bacterium]|nr:NAD(P)-binding protein [Burkholderiales bacterium]
MNIKIGIVGASIAGIATAIELERLGFNVTVFEKSNRISYTHGAGLMMPLKLIEELNAHDLLGKSFKYFSMNTFTTFLSSNKNEQKLLTQTSYHDSVTVHWGNLHSALEEKFNKSSCLYGYNVTSVINHTTYVELIINSKDHYQFDYIIFADGYNSLGRAKLFPELKLEVANYIAWRGLINVNQINSTKLLGYKYNKDYYRYLYEKGHLLMFPIPNNNPQLSKDDYIINWVLYENLALCDDNTRGALTRSNFAPGMMPLSYRKYLHNLAEQYLPEFPRELIKSTMDPFTQSISDILLPQYTIDNICLLGDASTLLRPHVGSNATKALQDALALGNFVRQELSNVEPNLCNALLKWSKSQSEKAQHLFPLSRALGELLVTNMPDLGTLDKERMDNLWDSTIEKYRWYGNKNANQF